jgi:hypothetical protein
MRAMEGDQIIPQLPLYCQRSDIFPLLLYIHHAGWHVTSRSRVTTADSCRSRDSTEGFGDQAEWSLRQPELRR